MPSRALDGEQNSQDQTSQTQSTASSGEADLDPRNAVFRSVSGLFSTIFAESVVVQVDPLRCISIKTMRSRPICRWGVKKIKQSILGQSTSQTFLNGFVSTGKFSVIAEIPEEHFDLVTAHFVEKGESQEVAKDLASCGKWYHTVEGSHVHQALVECIQDFPGDFAGFRWPVLKIAWQSSDTLQAIGRTCNEMNKEEHVVDFPLPDAMQSLRDIIDAHSKSTGVAVIPGERIKPGFIKEVIDIYAGRKGYSCNTLRTVCGSVVKLSSSFVSSMRSLLTEECEEFWRTLGAKRPFGDDTRVFKKLISTQSLKRATTFLDPKKITDEDRINVIHRLIFLAKEKESFKAFSSAQIETQTHRAVAAREKVTSFENFLGDETWPSEIENLRRNMLATPLFDDVVREHVGGKHELLPAIVSAYLKVAGAHGSQKLGQYQRMIQQDSDQNGDEVVNITACRRSRRISNVNDEIEKDGEGATVRNGTDQSGEFQDGTNVVQTEEHEVLEPVQDDPDDALRRAGVELSMETLLEYERGASEIGGSFDFVIGDPFQKAGIDPAESRKGNQGDKSSRVSEELVDEKGITMYLQSLRRLLQRGGYLFLFLDWDKLQQWKACCTESQLDIVCDPFLVMRDPTRIQKMTLKGLQSVYEPALVLRKPGEHPDGFEIDKSSPYIHLPACRMPRWCNVIDGVPPPAQKITFKPSRAQVRPGGKPCSLFIEILTTFCPPMGRVLDPFAGTLTTGLACMATDRRCVLLETDDKCVLHAKGRACDFAKSRLAARSENQNRVNDRDDADVEGIEGERNEEVEAELETDDNEVTDGLRVSSEPQNHPTGELHVRSSQEFVTELQKTPSATEHSEYPSREGRINSSKPGTHQNRSSEPRTGSQVSEELPISSSEVTAEDAKSTTDSEYVDVTDAMRTPTVKKRNRNIRSPAPARTCIVENSTPNAHRRSKRSRRTTSRCEK